jgi:predicted nucleic acid-binding Zn ribbon protein
MSRRNRPNIQQIIMAVIGILIVLSMVISMVARF